MTMTYSRLPLASLSSLALFSSVACGAIQWSIIDASDQSVVSTTTGSSITFEVPSGATYWAVATGFGAFDLTVPDTYFPVEFDLSVSAGFSGQTHRAFGLGLFDSGGTAGNYSDDAGYWARFNLGGPYFEMFTHTAGNPNLFTGSQQGQGGVYSGVPTDGEVYAAKFQLRTDGSGNVAMGGTTAVETAGASLVGTGVNQTAYTNAISPLATSVDLFAVYFNNQAGTSSMVNLGALSLITPIPEPSALAALAGLCSLLTVSRRRR
jgi:hypothetical protein